MVFILLSNVHYAIRPMTSNYQQPKKKAKKQQMVVVARQFYQISMDFNTKQRLKRRPILFTQNIFFLIYFTTKKKRKSPIAGFTQKKLSMFDLGRKIISKN